MAKENSGLSEVQTGPQGKSHSGMTLSQGKAVGARSVNVKVFGGHLIKLHASGLNNGVGSVDLKCFFKPA